MRDTDQHGPILEVRRPEVFVCLAARRRRVPGS